MKNNKDNYFVIGLLILGILTIAFFTYLSIPHYSIKILPPEYLPGIVIP